MTSKEAIKRLRQETCPCTYMPDFDKEECLKVIEKELKKPEELYNKIKEKRDSFRSIQDISDIERTEISAIICAYNNVLLLVGNMFEINMFEEWIGNDEKN